MSEWISVKQRLPTEEISCLVYMPEVGVKAVKFILKETFFSLEKNKDEDDQNLGRDYIFLDRISHWMPFPSPPKRYAMKQQFFPVIKHKSLFAKWLKSVFCEAVKEFRQDAPKEPVLGQRAPTKMDIFPPGTVWKDIRTSNEYQAVVDWIKITPETKNE